MGRADYYKRDSWNVRCECCGTKYKAEELRTGWLNGPAKLCRKCWQGRNVQEFVRGVPDNQSVPWSRPDPPPVFVKVFEEPGIRVLGASILDRLTMG
jgi:hypothetical protein